MARATYRITDKGLNERLAYKAMSEQPRRNMQPHQRLVAAITDDDIVALLEMLFPDGVPSSKFNEVNAWLEMTRKLVQ